MTSPTLKTISKLMLSLYLCFFLLGLSIINCVYEHLYFFPRKCDPSETRTHNLCVELTSRATKAGCLFKLAGSLCGVIEFLALSYCWCCYWLVCWPKPIWHKLVDHATMQWTFNLATVQFSLFDLGQPPTTNDTQTKYMQLATRLCVRVPAAAKYFLFQCLIWE